METYEWILLLGLGFLMGVFATLGLHTGFGVMEPQECPICESGNVCLFQPTEARFDRSGDNVNQNGFLKGNAKLTNTIKNLESSKALFNLRAQCKTLKGETDVYSGWEYIGSGKSKKLTAEMNTGITEDWECIFVGVESINIENSCKLGSI